MYIYIYIYIHTYIHTYRITPHPAQEPLVDSPNQPANGTLVQGCFWG